MTKKTEMKTVQLTSLKLLGGVAPVFDMPVKIYRIDGTQVEVVFKVKGMKRTDWAALRDAQIESMVAAAEKAVADDGKTTLVDRVTREVDHAVEIILKAATGWSLEEDFNAANLKAMEDLIPGALQETLAKIDIGLFQGRLGN